MESFAFKLLKNFENILTLKDQWNMSNKYLYFKLYPLP